MVGGAPVRTLRPPDLTWLRRKGFAMSTAVAARPSTQLKPARAHTVAARPAVAAPIARLLYMCEAAERREQQGEPAAPFHDYCLGRSRTPTRVLGKLADPDGRFSAGRHVCTCGCHANTAAAR